MSVTRFNKHNLQDLREVIEAALIVASEETGLDMQLGGCRFSSNSATFKLEVKTLDEEGRAFDEGAANFKVFAADFGLIPDDLGKTFTSARTTYTICGLKPKNRKYPIIARKSSGRTFKFSASMVQRLLRPDEIPSITRYPSPINGD